jgi:hypothetical protein
MCLEEARPSTLKPRTMLTLPSTGAQVLVWRSGLGPPTDSVPPALNGSQEFIANTGAAWRDEEETHKTAPVRPIIPGDNPKSQHSDPSLHNTVVCPQPSAHEAVPVPSSRNNSDGAHLPFVNEHQARCHTSHRDPGQADCNLGTDGSTVVSEARDGLASATQPGWTSNSSFAHEGMLASEDPRAQTGHAGASGQEDQAARATSNSSEQNAGVGPTGLDSHPEMHPILAPDAALVTMLMRQMEAMTRGISALDTRLAGLECQLEKSKGAAAMSGVATIET